MSSMLHTRVTRTPPAVSATATGRVLQRKCACGGTPGPTGECAECRKKRLQRRSKDFGFEGQNDSVVPPIVHEVLRAPGQPLDAQTRAFMEPRFGHNFSDAHIHNDGKASESARVVNARAFTLEDNVAFAAGQYSPGTTEGQRLLAPELTHVIQQNGAITQPTSQLEVSSPTDPLEQEAERSAENITRASASVVPVNGPDFTQVRIHTDARAVESARAVNALAYTVGSHIVFGAGQYGPETTSGRHLLAHELTHVVQQHWEAKPPILARVALTSADFNALAEALHNAMAGLGTDEEAIYVSLQKLERDPAAITSLRITYKRRFGNDLEAEIRDEMSGSELDFALELLGIPPTSGPTVAAAQPSSPGQIEAAARRLAAAMAGLGTDEEAIYATLLPFNRDATLLTQLKTTYQRIFGRSLQDEIVDEMSSSELAYALYLLNAPPPAAPGGTFQTIPGTGTPPAKPPVPVEGGQVSALTGVQYPTASGPASVTFAITYSGGLAADTRWLQFIWREMEVTAADGSVRRLSDPVTIGTRTYPLTINPGSPSYSVDSRSANDPFYEASTSTARREPDLTMIADAPTPIRSLATREYAGGARSVLSRAHFEIYLIRDYRTLYHVAVDIEHPFRDATHYGTNRQIRVTEVVSELPGELRATLVRDYPAFSYIQ